MSFAPIRKSKKLDHVCYDIRGPVLERARQMEDEGHKIIKLNIGNLAAFGFDSPEALAANWKKFVSDPEWTKLKNDPTYADTEPTITNLILRPSSASQI